MAAAYERKWIAEPKETLPKLTTDIASTASKEATASPTSLARTLTSSTRTPRNFIPALPSNPRPRRRQSEDINHVPNDLHFPKPRESTIAPRPEPARLPSILKSPKVTRSPSTKSSSVLPPLSLPSPTILRRSNTTSSSSPQHTSPIVQIGRLTQLVGSPALPPEDRNVTNIQPEKSPLPEGDIYLRVVDIPPSQRSSDTMPGGFSLGATDQSDPLLTPGPTTPSEPLQSIGHPVPASPPFSDEGPDARTPLTPLVEIQPELQPAPLNVKTQALPNTTIPEPRAPTPPPKGPSPPPEAALPPLPTQAEESQLLPEEQTQQQQTQQPHRRTLSVKFKPEVSSANPRRKPSNAGNTSLAPLAPRSLTTHLLGLGNTPRKLYLATHSPFLRCISSSKASTGLLSEYLTRERLYLHSTLRFLSLLLANIILPTKPSGLISKRRGGVRERMRTDAEKLELARKEDAQKRQKDFGPGMGANLGIEVAAGVANLGMGMVLGGIAGIGTGIGVKTATGSAGVGLSNLGNSAADSDASAAGEGRIEEVLENVHKDVGERAVDFLIKGISRTRGLIELFEEISEDIGGIGLDGGVAEGEGEEVEMSALTMFVRLFGEIGGAVEKRERSVLAGLTMLFAREKAHLDSWLDVKSTLSTHLQNRPTSVSLSQKRKSEPDRGVIRIYLLPAFTDEESVSYVDDLKKLVDDLWEDRYVKRERDGRFLERRDTSEKKKKGKMRGDGMGMGMGIWEEDVKGLEELFEMVLDIQGRFWPVLR